MSSTLQVYYKNIRQSLQAADSQAFLFCHQVKKVYKVMNKIAVDLTANTNYSTDLVSHDGGI